MRIDRTRTLDAKARTCTRRQRRQRRRDKSAALFLAWAFPADLSAFGVEG